MKKTLTAITLLAGAVAGYSQGAINFDIYVAGFKQAIYNTQATGNTTPVTFNGYTVNEIIGSSTQTHESPTGSAVYSGGGLSGTGYDVELLVGPAGSTLASTGAAALQEWGGVGGSGTTPGNFHTAAGNIGFASVAETVNLPTQASFTPGDTVSVAIAAWNNEGGTVTTLAAAQAADAANPNSDPWGISNVIQLASVGGGQNAPSSLVGSGLTSFDLGYASPEPSTIALGVMGASAFLFRRRK